MRGNGVVAQLQERVDTLEREVHRKRQTVESLSMQVPSFLVSRFSLSPLLEPKVFPIVTKFFPSLRPKFRRYCFTNQCDIIIPLCFQLDMERDSSARDSKRASSTASGASMHSEVLSQELQKLSDIKIRLEEENNALRRKVLELEDSNNTLRKQLVDARRFFIYMFHCSLLTYSLYIFFLHRTQLSGICWSCLRHL
jgi:hypothetical protein